MPKKSLLCVCAALAALLMAALPAAAGSVGGYSNATIPFDFVVAGTTMPAGQYSFELIAGQSMISVRGANGHKVMGFMSRRDGNSITETKPQLIFHKQGNQFVLKEVWTNTPAPNSTVK
jgi:hypothetical protein